MSGLNDKILEFGQKRDVDQLELLIKNTELDDILYWVKENVKSSNFCHTWNYFLQGLTGSSSSQDKRFNASRAVLEEVDGVTSSTANTLVQRLCIELHKFKSDHLSELCNFCLNSIQSKSSGHKSWKDLLPELLNVLATRDHVEYDDVEYTGPEYKSMFINTLCMSSWAPSMVTLLTSMFIEMTLTKEEHLKVVNKLGQYLDKLTPQEIPPFIYQILRLCKNSNIRSMFLRLQNYFGLRIYEQQKNDDESNSENTFDGIESTNNQDLLEAECTILYHIHTSASLGHESIKDYLNSLKKLQKSPECILHPFQLMLLFTVSTISYYEDIVFEIMRPSIVRCFQEEIKINNSSWLKDMVPSNCNVANVFNQVINYSLQGRDFTLKALVNFAFVLLGIGSALGRDVMAEKQWCIGNMILLKIIKRKRNIAPTIIQMLSNHIVSGHSVTQYIECFYIVSRSYPLLMIENQSCVVELMECLVQIPGPTAMQLLDALIPLTKVSVTIRDHLIILLRKALYSRTIETGQMAVTGFLKLMAHLKISNLTMLSQSSNSSGSYASGHSFFTQLSLNRSSQLTSSTFSNEALCLEVLSILKRCFMQHVELRSKLYDGLYDAVCMNPELGVSVLDVMWLHFETFYVINEEQLPPLKFNQIVVTRDVDSILQEPLGKLIHAISQIVTKVAEGDENLTVIKFTSVLDSLCQRMARCELVHFELDDGTDLLDVVPESQEKVHVLKEAMSVYEALIGYKILSWDRQSEHHGQDINGLYQGYARLMQFSKISLRQKKDGRKKKLNDTTQNNSNVLSQKKDKDAQKTKVIKTPDTIWDYKTVIKALVLLHEPEVDWIAHSKANVLKTKREFHQHVMQATNQMVLNVKGQKDIDTGRSKMHFDNFVEIGRILYRRVVKRFNEFIDFDCTTGIMTMECFQNILLLMTGQYKNNFDLFLSKLGEEMDSEDIVNNTLQMGQVIEVYQKLFEIDEEETSSDPEIKKLSGIVINTLTILANQTSSRQVNLVGQLYEWIKQYAYGTALSSKVSIPFANLFFDTHIKCKVSLTLLESVSIYVGDVIGFITEDEHEAEKFEFIHEGTVQNVLTCLNGCIKSELENIELITSRLKSEYSMVTFPGQDNVDKKMDQLKNKERGVCCQLCFIVTILTNINNVTLQPGSTSDVVFKNTMLLFATLSSLTKYFMMRSSKANVAFQGARFERLVKLAGKQLAPVVYKFILYIEENQKQLAETKTSKKRNVDPSTLKNKVLKETRMIPKVVYEMEQFSKCVTQLSNKTKVDLTKYVGMGIVRDFRILKLKEVLEQAGDNSFLTTQQTEMDTSREVENSDKENESESDESVPPTKKSRSAVET